MASVDIKLATLRLLFGALPISFAAAETLFFDVAYDVCRMKDVATCNSQLAFPHFFRQMWLIWGKLFATVRTVQRKKVPISVHFSNEENASNTKR